MKQAIIFLIMLVSAMVVKAQDIITLKSGETVSARVTEVNPAEIKYKHGKVIYTIKKEDVVMILYKGGRKEYFSEQPPATSVSKISAVKPDSISRGNDSVMSTHGKEDAKRYYTKYKNAASWTMASTWLTSPVIGLVPALSCATTPPKDKNLGCLHPELLRDPAYDAAYRAEVQKIKSRKVWTGYAYGAAIWAILIVFIETVVKHT